MAQHPNVARLLEGHEIRTRLPLEPSDRKALDDLLSDDVVWHGAGRSPWARDYAGKPAVLALFEEMGRTATNLKLSADSIFADDSHGVINARIYVDLGDRQMEWQEVQVFHMEEGRIKEFWGVADDQEQVDSFLLGG